MSLITMGVLIAEKKTQFVHLTLFFDDRRCYSDYRIMILPKKKVELLIQRKQQCIKEMQDFYFYSLFLES